MKNTEESRVLECYQAYKDTVFKLAYSYCKDKSQAEDAFQEVFYKFMRRSPQFKDREHEKAWFIRTTINVCKDILKNTVYPYICITMRSIPCARLRTSCTTAKPPCRHSCSAEGKS